MAKKTGTGTAKKKSEVVRKKKPAKKSIIANRKAPAKGTNSGGPRETK